MVQKILRLPQVRETVGLSRSSIYQMISKGTFPRAMLLGQRAVGWDAEEVASWLQQKAQARGGSK